MSDPFDTSRHGSDGAASTTPDSGGGQSNPFQSLIAADVTAKRVALTSMEMEHLQQIFTVLRVSPYGAEEVPEQAGQSRTVQVIHLSDLNSAEPSVVLSQLDELLFERLMMSDEQLRSALISVPIGSAANYRPSRIHDESDPVESRQLFYLYQCFQRLFELKQAAAIGEELNGRVREALVNQAASYLMTAPIYPVSSQTAEIGAILELLDKYSNEFGVAEILGQFLELVAERINRNTNEDDGSRIGATLRKIMDEAYYGDLNSRFNNVSLIDPNLHAKFLNNIRILSSGPNLSRCFIELNSPWLRAPEGQKYNFKTGLGNVSMSDDIQKTLLGKLLSVSCLPGANLRSEFFDRPSRYSHQEHEITEKNIGTALRNLVNSVHQLFMVWLRQGPSTKEMLLDWIGLVLYAFRDRSKMWTNEMIMSLGSSVQSSDGFMLNFSSVLLELCRPFSSPYSPKLLKIDGRYCRAPQRPLESSGPNQSGAHIRSLAEETMLVRSESAELGELPKEWNFMTEVFYATHKALQIGFRSCHERLLKLGSDMSHIQQVFEEARQQAGAGADLLDRLEEQQDKGMSQYLSLKAMLGQPDGLELMINFYIASCTWLSNLAVSPDPVQAAAGFRNINQELLESSNANLQSLIAIPELIVENIIDLIAFVRRFADRLFSGNSVDLDPIMTLIVVFMGSADRMQNPHSRARLAEVLEYLMPRTGDDFLGPMNYSLSYDMTNKLFKDHSLVPELVPTLLHVFVSIEMTGQSVQFEQKFQYRRPMYNVLKYLCVELAEAPHANRMIKLAAEAESNMNAPNPPLFLRFINFLINDAIFLLDEGLKYMSRIKELQQEKERNPQGWTQQNQGEYRHIGQLARFHNVIGKNTIDTLAWLTNTIKTIFCHDTLVDRVAAMLNYFLKILVSPKNAEYKVRQMEDYDFRPADIVKVICTIYANLASKLNPKDREFCVAIADDARSYTADLLPAAGQILLRTGNTMDNLYQKMERIATKIERLSKEKAETEIDVDDLPSHFVDPILSTLMRDPVILPSGETVDRATIARHLLSDQTDPFTRQPLTMDMLKPNAALKEEIETWIDDYNQKRINSKAEPEASSSSTN